VTLGRGNQVTLGRGNQVTLGRGNQVTLGRGNQVTLGRGNQVTLGNYRMAKTHRMPCLHYSIHFPRKSHIVSGSFAESGVQDTVSHRSVATLYLTLSLLCLNLITLICHEHCVKLL